jgi:hypothetical protein
MNDRHSQFVLGQRYAFATIALVVAALSFINLAGTEKAILAILLGIRALGEMPAPRLEHRRRWAAAGVALASLHIVMLVTIVLIYLDRLPKVLEVLRALSDVR